MKMRRTLVTLVAQALATTAAVAGPVDIETATAVAITHASERGAALDVTTVTPYPSARPVFFVAALAPVGFVVVAGDTDLPPVIGYSFQDDFPTEWPAFDAMVSLLSTDLETRLAQVPLLPAERVDARRAEWRRVAARPPTAPKRLPQVWPPAGSTPTGGWVVTLWHQNAPYSDQCPMDLVNGARSVAGCPAVAMAQIVNFHRTTNGVGFRDSDDYYHSYQGRTYWIDDDYATVSFPSFRTLTGSLVALEQHYAAGAAPTDAEAAALVFACGVAATQVYTSSGSGTFGVDQAVDAYHRFGVTSESLLGDAPESYQRLADNMKQALPAHLAVVDPGWSYGHNVVVDGYDDGDGRFHLDFGWGGSANGWYLLPDEMPYGLTVIEGIVVDIHMSLVFADGVEMSDLSRWSEALP